MKPNRPKQEEAGRPKLSHRPRQYIDVNDLGKMLKLGLGLHLGGDPIKRLNRACNGLTKLAGADTWVAAVLGTKPHNSINILSIISGGKDARTIQMQFELNCRQRDASVKKLLESSTQIPGRVFAVIAKDETDRSANAVQTVLRFEADGRRRDHVTWISIHRSADGKPFLERERRLVELFHSQTAWLLLQSVPTTG